MAKRLRTVQAPSEPRTVELPPLSIRADVVAKSVNEEARTVELVFTTGAPVQRYDWMSDKRYLETLSLDPEHVRLDRLNEGGPLLDSHSAWSVSDQLGAIVPGSVRLLKTEGRATVRFSRRDAEVEGVWQDVKDGIIRSVSVGYRVHKFEETAPSKANALPVRKAIDWEPFEISMVPIPADAGAKVRGEKPTDTNPCQIVTRGASKETTMAKRIEDEAPDSIVEEPELPATERSETPAESTEADEREAGAAAELERVEGIRSACLAARLPRSFEDKLIRDRKLSLVKAQGMVFDELRKRGGDSRGPGQAPSGGEILVGDDPLVHKLDGIRNAILHRAAPELRTADGKPVFALDENGRQYRGMSLLDVGRTILNARGMRTTHLTKMDLAAAALGLTRAGMHTTSDFADLLADVANKVLRAAYEAAPQTWLPIARRVSVPDFKPVKQLSLGDAPALLEILEGGEYTRGTIAESKETYTLASFGRVFAITRKALVNDDTDAFSRVAMLFGRAARNLESKLVWEQITNNGNMGDGVALFHATHANLAAVDAAITVASIGIGRAAMRNQKGLDAETLLNIAPRYLIVPPAIETVADQFVSVNLLASAPGSVNPFAGRLTVISEPRLETVDANAWFLAASPDQIDMILYGTLQDQDGPRVESRLGFDVDGIEIKAGHDFVAKVVDHRGLFKNNGA